MSDTQLRVLIVDQNLARATILEEGLRDAYRWYVEHVEQARAR